MWHRPGSNLHHPQQGQSSLSSQIHSCPQHKLQVTDQQNNPNQMVAAMVVALAEALAWILSKISLAEIWPLYRATNCATNCANGKALALLLLLLAPGVSLLLAPGVFGLKAWESSLLGMATNCKPLNALLVRNQVATSWNLRYLAKSLSIRYSS